MNNQRTPNHNRYPSGSDEVERLIELTSMFDQQCLLVVGDLMLDRYCRGRAAGLSPEAPVVDLINPSTHEMPGGAANVAANAVDLGAGAHLVGVIGCDSAGAILTDQLTKLGRVKFTAISDAARPTTTKVRYCHDNVQLLRVTFESRKALSEEFTSSICSAIDLGLSDCSAVLVQDYGKGVVTAAMIKSMIDIRLRFPDIPLLLDPKPSNRFVYRPGMCSVMKLNWREACELSGTDANSEDYEQVAINLGDAYECDIVVTLGGAGCVTYERSSACTVVPTRRREAFDVAGAGDTFLVALALSQSVGASLHESAIIGNICSGRVVEKPGTASVSSEELRAGLLAEANAIISQSASRSIAMRRAA